MQTLDVLLIVSLYRHAAQTRPAGSFCNCKGIVVITLIATHKGSDMLGWDELHPVPHRLKATSPVMTGVTCFHGKLYRSEERRVGNECRPRRGRDEQRRRERPE